MWIADEPGSRGGPGGGAGAHLVGKVTAVAVAADAARSAHGVTRHGRRRRRLAAGLARPAAALAALRGQFRHQVVLLALGPRNHAELGPASGMLSGDVHMSMVSISHTTQIDAEPLTADDQT